MSDLAKWLPSFDLGWLGWFGISGTIAALIATAWFLPFLKPVIELASEFAKPLVRSASELLVWVLGKLAKGLADIMDSLATVVTVVLIGLACLAYGKAITLMPEAPKPTAEFCKPIVEQLRRDYKFVPLKKGS